MSGHIVNVNIPHPMREQQDKEMPFALRAACPHCGAFPGRPCFLKDWTHPARSEKARQLDREGKLLKKKTLNDLPEFIKKDLVAYCTANCIDPRELHNLRTEELFNYWCVWNNLTDLGTKLLNVFESIKEVKG
jgi:hypothetical protein